MRVIYSMDTVRMMHDVNERDLAHLLADIKGLQNDPPAGNIRSIPGKSQRKKYLCSGNYRVVFKPTRVKGEDAWWITEILSKEEMEEIYHL